MLTRFLLCHGLEGGERPAITGSAGPGIKLPPQKSLLKLEAGDEIRLTEADFVRLAEAFFAELEKKYL